MNLPVPAERPPVPQVFTPLSLSVSPEQKLELLEYWRSITKRKWLVLGLALASAVVAAVVALALTPVYRSTATVLVEAGKGKILSFEDMYGANTQREHFQTQVELLKSREVAERTVKAMNLAQHPLFDPRQATASAWSQVKAVAGMGREQTEVTEADVVAGAVTGLRGSLSVEPVRLSQLVKVSFESPDKDLAAKVANELSRQYIESDRDAKFKISQEVSGFLQERLTSLREKLTESEKALQAYREKKGIVNVAGSPQTMSSQQAGGMSDRLLSARARRLELESSYLQARAITNGDYAGIPVLMRDPAVLESQRQMNDATRRLVEATETLGSEHPKVRLVQSELAQLQRTLAGLRRDAVSSLTRDYEAARSTEQSLERALSTARTDVQSINRGEFELAVLDREVQTNRQLYDMFMSRAKETNLAGDVQSPVARLVDAAVPMSIPVRPAKVQIVLVAAVLALFLGAMASILIDRLDNTVKGGEDAEIRLRYPVLAALPDVPGLDRARMARIFLDDGHSHYAEAVRTARTGVLLSNLDVPNKVLLITSSLPGEGKTTVALNLALAHAQTKKTLLVDCDMRRSQASRSVDLPPGAKGITNLVAGAPLEDCVFAVPDSNLTMLPVGDLPPNPLELLLSQRFKDTLKMLSEQYEMVIIDSPPVELVSDALVLAPMATATAFVIKAMSTPAPLARKSLARLQRGGAHILGTVVNVLDFEHARVYYGEYTASSYNYDGYGYGGKGGKLTYGAPPAADASAPAKTGASA